jgi:hypothetical protein
MKMVGTRGGQWEEGDTRRRSQGFEARRGRRDWARGREAGAGVSEGVSSVTPTGMGGAQRRLTIAAVFHRENACAHGAFYVQCDRTNVRVEREHGR